MTYKILHKLFGWDYIEWRRKYSHGISRVHKSKTGHVFYIAESSWCKYVLEKVEIYYPDDVIWLTCKPDKYLNNNYDYQGLERDLHELIRVALTNPKDLKNYIRVNYPEQYNELTQK
jgi:hypothetical protein